jgi:myo-inositol-1(or 4)-monophosphatase
MIETLREVASEVQKAVQPIKDTREAGEVIKMGADGTPTVMLDDVAEKAALDVLRGTNIPMVVLSEEAGTVTMGDNPEYICVLDPVDGTHNAVHGIPFYSISIGLGKYKEDATTEDIELGLVMNLETGDVFEAEKGKGATFNGSRIKTEDKRLGDSTFCIYMRNDIERLSGLLRGVKRVRNMGSVALELCYIAKGDYHGLVDLRNLLKVIDIAAGKLILEEAGGICTPETSILNLEGITVVACSSEKLYKDVAGLL